MATIDARRVETIRRIRGLSQRALSEAAGITRQAVSAIESGRMQPSVGIALGLARALGTTVEELFTAAEQASPRPTRVATATIGGRTVTHPLDQDYLAIEPAESAVPNAFVAGCDLSAGLLSRHAMMRTRGIRVLWLTMTNRAAMQALRRGTVHAAVVHEPDASKRSAPPGLLRFELAATQAGWLVARGNPLNMRGTSDLARKKVRLINRPSGAGARRLLDEQLRGAKMDPRAVCGYDRVLSGQLDAGRAVAQGFADAAVGLASAASVFGLDFLPLCDEHCDVLVSADATRTPEIRAFLDALRSASYRRDLEALNSYDVTKTGERIK